ncbi:MAG: ZIP family metal transporter [Chloroflexi bacterium]|nr:ZIP family metal transporter [Chloroflexota bacterium]
MPVLLGLLVGLMSVAGVLIGAGLVVAMVQRHHGVMPALLALASGTLLAAALGELIPEAGEYLPLESVTWLVLLAIIAFLLLERWILWRHTHELSPTLTGRAPGQSEAPAAGHLLTAPEHQGHRHAHAAGYLILVGDGVHNFVDGVLLGAAFVADVHVGLAVGVAVLAHEVPQEVGDFVLLVESGLSKARALAYNLLSAATIFPGVVVGYLLVEQLAAALGVALAIAAGGFLYVALADLVPDLRSRYYDWGETIKYQLVPLGTGVAVIALVQRLGA